MKTIHPLINRRLTLISLAIALAACSRGSDGAESSEHDLAGVPIGQVRGVVGISDTLRTRLLDDTDPATPTFSVDRVAGRPIFRLRRQLGVFAQAGTQTEFQGGTPTPFNIALWHQVFARFGDGVANTCDAGSADFDLSLYDDAASEFEPAPPGKRFRLFPTVAEKIKATCTFEGDQAARRASAGAVWDVVMGRGGSLAEEKEAFLVRFAADGSPFIAAPAKDRVRSMLVAMLLNPHFLLAK
jgi:hypothetical protein